MRLRLPVFWLSVAVLLAIAVHLSYVLFSPSMAMDGKINRAITKAGINAFSVLSDSESRSLTGLSPAGSIYAICPYDLGAGELNVTAHMPARPWSLSVYGASGGRLFSVNDKQAGVDSVILRVQRGPDLLDMLKESAPPEISDGWSIEVKEPRGLALLWMAESDPTIGAAVRAELAKSTCTVVPPEK